MVFPKLVFALAIAGNGKLVGALGMEFVKIRSFVTGIVSAHRHQHANVRLTPLKVLQQVAKYVSETEIKVLYICVPPNNILCTSSQHSHLIVVVPVSRRK